MVQPLAQLRPFGTGPRVEASGAEARIVVGNAVRSENLETDFATGSPVFSGGALELAVEREAHGEAATLHLALCNRGSVPLRIETIELSLSFLAHGLDSFRFLKHGWQSWSPTRVDDLDERGSIPFPSGPWLRGIYHCQSQPRPGWHESETLVLIGGPEGGPFCLVGALERGHCFTVMHARAEKTQLGNRPVSIRVEFVLEVVLEPGESRGLESLRVAVGQESNSLLEHFAELWGNVAGARRNAPFQRGWCSWYHFFHRISERDLMRNLEAMVADRDGIPVDVVQLDDGFQLSIGDWLATGEEFPKGLAYIAQEIRAAGYRAGIWTAPFAASEESRVLVENPEWALRDGEGRLRGNYNPEWSRDGWVYALDTSRPDVQLHLETLFHSLVEMGFDYLKLDFLYMAAMRGQAMDASLTRAQRLRRGLEAIRRGAGDDAFLLGCGCPFGPAVGIVDGMRIGPDVAPSWYVDQPVVLPGLEEMLPSTRTALRSILARQFMHRRLWLNDPDCLMVRNRETQLREDESASLATGIALSGGMVVFSDDVALLDSEQRASIRKTMAIAEKIDASSARGSTRIAWPQECAGAGTIEARGHLDAFFGAVNLSDLDARVFLPTPPAGSAQDAVGLPILGQAAARESSGDGRSIVLSPHASAGFQIEGMYELAVFCDFDGTFSTTDVGSTLARRELSAERSALRARFESGELDAWSYIVQLFDGFDYSREELEIHLRGIELDPGAREILHWCEDRRVAFQILSDGFDYNLERLQAIHDISFQHSSNRLRFEGDVWRVKAGGPNPDCGCRTGICKRLIIDRYRSEHPRSLCVHIGDGLVSDLCGAEAADLVFAKGSLAPALAARGVHFEKFDSLSDVVGKLDLFF